MGSSKKQTVGYRYYMGLHFGLCHGPVDKLLKVKAGDRDAWVGEATTNQTIQIDAPELFGGDKKEGGIGGQLSILMGAPSQGVDSYLASKLGAAIPAFRGILSAVWRGGQVSANNPYIKPWSFMVQRIAKGWANDTPWNPTKATVRVGSIAYVTGSFLDTFAAGLTPWSLLVGSLTGFSIVEDDYGPCLRVTDGPNNRDEIRRDFPPDQATGVAFRFKVEQRRDDDDGVIEFRDPGGSIVFGFVPGLQGDPMRRPTFTFSDDPSGTQYFMGEGSVNIGEWYEFSAAYSVTGGQFLAQVRSVETGIVHSTAEVPIAITSPISRIVIRTDSYIGTGSGTVLWDTIAITFGRIQFVEGMNGAHIIYQALTDREWGMGYPASVIDNDSFTEAANTLHGEGFGMCMIWNRQETVDDFIKVVLNHIGARRGVDPRTGKFTLKLIRDDYDPETLPIFDASNIIELTDHQRKTEGETVNEVTAVYRDWETNKDSAVTVQDMGNIQTQGAVVPQTNQYPGVPNAGLAQRLAMRDLNTMSTPLASAKFTATREAWNLLPGDVFRLRWPQLDIYDVVYRVLDVNSGTLQNGTLTISASEDVFGMPANTYVAEQPGEWVDPATPPEPAPDRKLVEAPYWDLARNLSPADLDYLDDLSGYLETLASKPSPDAINYELNARTGGADFEERTIGEFAPVATLTADVAKTDANTAITFSGAAGADLFEVDGYGMLGDEVVGFVALDALAGTATIKRGLLDTTPAAHASGALLWFADGFQAADQTEYAQGEVVDAKILPRTGLGELALDDAPVDSITMARRHNRPYPPGRFRINTLAWPVELVDVPLAASWVHRDRLSQTAYLVEQSENSIGPEAGTTYTARLYDDVDGTLLDSQTGIAGTTWAGPTLNGVFRLRLEVHAVRAGLESWQPQAHTFIYINGARLTEAGDNRETETGDIRALE